MSMAKANGLLDMWIAGVWIVIHDFVENPVIPRTIILFLLQTLNKTEQFVLHLIMKYVDFVKFVLAYLPDI